MSLLQSKFLIIDYGSHSIKGLLCENGPFGQKILCMEKLGVVEVEDDENREEDESEETSENKEIKTREKVTWAKYEYNLIRFVQSFFPDELSFALNLKLENIHTRDLSLPILKPKELGQSIAFEMEESLPQSLEEMEVVGHSWNNDGENLHILGFGTTRHETLEKSVSPLLGSQSIILDISPNVSMLASFLRYFGPSFYKDISLGQIDIGANYTIFNIVYNGKLSFSRSLPFGGNDINQILVDVLKIDPSEAEQKKLDLGLDIVDLRPRSKDFYTSNSISMEEYDKILGCIRAFLDKICLEIERSLFALRCSTPDHFYLSGGTSLCKGICFYLRENLQRNVDFYPAKLDNNEDIVIWATALGAREKFNLPNIDRDNFIETPFGSSLRGGKFEFGAFKFPLAFGLASLFFMILSMLMGIRYDQSLITQYKEEIKETAESVPNLLAGSSPDQIVMQLQDICRKRLRGVKRSIIKMIDLMRELNVYSPSAEEMEIKFRKFYFKTKSLEIEVDLDDVGKSSLLQEKLRESPFFQEVIVKRRKILANQSARVLYSLVVKDKKISTSGVTQNCL